MKSPIGVWIASNKGLAYVARGDWIRTERKHKSEK